MASSISFESLRKSLLSRGSFTTFVTRPISGSLIGLIALFVAWQLIGFFMKARNGSVAAQESPAAGN